MMYYRIIPTIYENITYGTRVFCTKLGPWP